MTALSRLLPKRSDPAALDRLTLALERIPNANGQDVVHWVQELIEAGRMADRLDAPSLSDSKFRKVLWAVAARAWRLEIALAQLPPDVCRSERWFSDLQASLPKLMQAVDSELEEITRRRGPRGTWKGKGRPPTRGAKHVATVAGKAFFTISGDRPGRSVFSDADKEEDREKGEFLMFLKEVFEALGITASPASHARYAARANAQGAGMDKVTKK